MPRQILAVIVLNVFWLFGVDADVGDKPALRSSGQWVAPWNSVNNGTDQYSEDSEGVTFAEDVSPATWVKLENARMLSQRTHENDVCAGCDFTIDLRCQGMRGGRHAFFHRVTECLLPAYGLITKAREAKGQRCILTWLNDHEINIEPLLSVLAADLGARLISEDQPCVATAPYHAAEPHFELGARRDFIDNFGKDPLLAGRYPVDVQGNVRAMQQDAFAIGGPARDPVVIFATRKGPDRAFTPEAQGKIATAMQEIARGPGAGRILSWHTWKSTFANLRYTEYKGEESAADTIKLFIHAVGVVGYHGAGFVNVVFGGHPMCVEEVTTFMNEEGTKLWRTNDQLAQLNPWLKWEKLVLPLADMLKANLVNKEQLKNERTDMNHFIKDLPWVGISEEGIQQLTRQFSRCLEREVFMAPQF